MTLYQHTPKASKANSFNWDDGEPSIFATDSRFIPLGEQKRSASEAATSANDAYRAANGKCRGTMTGISRSEKILANKWGGSVSKAVAG